MVRMWLMGLAVAAALTWLPGEGRATTAAEYLAAAAWADQQAQALEANANRLTAGLRQQALAQAQQLRRMAQSYRQLAGQASQPSARPTPAPQPPAFDAAQVARQANQRWLDWAARNPRPGRNGGFLIYYSNPPIYQGQTQFTPAARPYFVRPYELYRTIQMLTNNRQVIRDIQPY